MEAPIFQDVTNNKPDRNAFDLSHQVLLTCGMGDLIPTLCQEVVPGDKFRIRSEIFARMMALKHPIMQKIDIYAHYFFVPNRLLWNANNQNDSWQAFITGGRDGSVEPTPPYFTHEGIASINSNYGRKYLTPCTLLDYLGYPVFDSVEDFDRCVENGEVYSQEKQLAYPILAYNLIYDNYYRDQNLTLPIFKNEEVLSGDNILGGSFYGANIEGGTLRLFDIKKRAWRKDYFTSALPWAQRGEPVELPIGIFAPLATRDGSQLGNGMIDTIPTAVSVLLSDEDLFVHGNSSYPIQGSNSLVQAGVRPEGSSSDPSLLSVPVNKTLVDKLGNEGLGVDLREATAVTINQLRASIKIQEWLERNATGGARYVEQIYAHFGVVVPDATMQRPIYLGGGKQIFQVSEVTQTSQGTQDSPLGSYAGQGYSLGDHIGFDGYQFNEHGWIMCIMSIIPKASYMQGLNRKFSRFNKFDYYFPEFAHLGEQEIKNKEVVMTLDDSDGNIDDSTFGYQSRYAEYRYNDDRVCGDFRDSLIDWHLGRKFDISDGPIQLTTDFIEVKPEETNRIFAYTADDSDHKPLMIQIWHDIQAIRPMPVFATPWI